MIRDKVTKEIFTPNKLDDFNHEDVLREKMLAFERAQVKKKLRPPLPVDVRIAARNVRLIPREVLDVMKDIEVLNASEIAERMDCKGHQLTNHLTMLNKQGYLHRIVQTKLFTKGARKIVYAYIKTGKVFDGGS